MESKIVIKNGKEEVTRIRHKISITWKNSHNYSHPHTLSLLTILIFMNLTALPDTRTGIFHNMN